MLHVNVLEIQIIIENLINEIFTNKMAHCRDIIQAIVCSCDCFHEFINNRDHITRKTYYGFTPLHIAVFSNNIEFAKILIQNGSTNINEKDDFGHTPLYISAEKGYTNMVQLLLDYGADITIKSNDNKTASGVSRTPLIKELIDNYDVPTIKGALDHNQHHK